MKLGAYLWPLGFSLGLIAPGARAQNAPAATGLTAGGLAPPGAGQSEPSAAPPAAEQELRRAEREDVGRGLEWFWINAEIGFEHLGLRTLHDGQLVDAATVRTTQSGFVVGAGLGARLLIFTVGPRFRYAKLSDFALWTLGGEVGFRIPIGRLEPYALVSAGYASAGPVTPRDGQGSQDLGIRGWDLRAGGGLDLYLTPRFSVGGAATAEILFLTRGAQSGAPDGVYAGDGSSIGSALAVTAVAGLHF